MIEAQKVNLVNTSDSSNKNHPLSQQTYLWIKREEEKPRPKISMEK